MGNVRIACGRLSAEIAPRGAELQRLTDAGAGELLWNGDPAFWTGRAPILFPIVGTLRGNRYRHDGQSYALGRHGFAKQRDFTLAESGGASALFRLVADAETRAVYPFDFTLEIGFALTGEALTITAKLRNEGAATMPASFGFHPALRWPLPYGGARSAHRLCFAEAEPAPIRRIDGDGLLRPEGEATPVAGRELGLRDSLFEDDALIFLAPNSRSLVYGAPGHAALSVEWDLPDLGVWTKPGAGYVCVEPWAGYSDPEGFAGPIEKKPGILLIAPREERRFTMRIALREHY